MVEFISPNDVSEEVEETEEPDSPEEEEEQKSLENLVEEQTEELETREEEDPNYLDEPANEPGEYMHPDNALLKAAPELKETIKPLVYDENDIPVVSDVFTRYGKKEDKWWLDKVNVGVLK